MTPADRAAGRPRIGIDLLCLDGERTGMAWVAWWLAHLMPGMAPDLTFVFFLPPDAEPPATNSNVEMVRVPTSRLPASRILTEQWNLPRLARREQLDLLHTIAFGPPVLHGGTKVLTVHDLGFRVYPETLPWRYRLYWNWAYGGAARGCRRLIAVSESTRRDIVGLLGWDPDRVSVIHPGVDPIYSPAASGEATRRRLDSLGLPAQFILNVGTLQPRKDLVTLLETFARLRRAFADLHLVVCGGPGWGYGNLEAMVRKQDLEGRVRFIGYTARDLMPDLYRGASLLLFTSRYEGFGLPLVEAMSSGTPVVAAATSSIPEVTGDAALLAPAGDDEALAAQARRVIEEPGLRSGLAARGIERARLFTWQEAARKTAEVYRQVLAERRP